MTREYEGEGLGSLLTSRNTSRGVPTRGELKGFKPRRRRETEWSVAGREVREGLGLNGPVVTGGRPETGRSSPGQGEAGRKPCGGPKGF